MSLKLVKFMKKIYEISQQEGNNLLEQLFGKPLFDAGNIEKYLKDLEKLAKLNRPPFPSQVEQGILPLKESLEKYKAGVLLGEMGIGKTQISFSLIEVLKLKKRKILFLTAGSKHLRKMKREAEEILGEKAIVYTIVNKSPKRTKKEILPEEVYKMKAPKGKYLIFLLSKDTAKYELKEESIIKWGEKCPFCGKEVWPASWNSKKIETAKQKGLKPASKVSHCLCGKNLLKKVAKNIAEGEILFPKRIEKNKKNKGQRRISIGERLKRMTKSKTDKIFDYLIVDEAHEMQNPFSLQSKVYRELVRISHKTLIMTGTLTNGYTSSLYYILYPILSWYFKEKGYQFYDVQTFVEHYGERKKTRTVTEIDKGKGNVKIQELPKISDRIISFLAPFTSWIKIEDLNIKMPIYTEKAITVSHNPLVKEGLNWYISNVIDYIKHVNINYISNFALRIMYLENNPFIQNEFEIISSFDSSNQTSEYVKAIENLNKLKNENDLSFIQIEEFVNKIIKDKKGNKPESKIRLKIKYPGINAILKEKEKIEKNKQEQNENQDDIVFENCLQEEKIPQNTILPKEKKLIEKVKQDLAKNRNVLIYTIYNKVAQIDKRIYNLLIQEEIVNESEIAILPENLKSEKIEKWIEQNPVKILIASPIKLATGLDLVQFASIIFYETGTNLRVIQQASRRSWRAVGQKHPVTVEFFAYEGIQADLLALIGKKLKAAATVDGRKIDQSQLSHVFDEDKALTRVLNKIAEEIEHSDYAKANFTNIYEHGKLRPLTKMEAKYKELLDINKLSIQIETENEKTEKINNKENKKENIELFKLNDNLFNFVSEEESEIEEIFEIKIKKRGNQYIFDF